MTRLSFFGYARKVWGRGHCDGCGEWCDDLEPRWPDGLTVELCGLCRQVEDSEIEAT